MCILLKLHYEKFDVSRLSCSEVIEEKPLRGSARPTPYFTLSGHGEVGQEENQL